MNKILYQSLVEKNNSINQRFFDNQDDCIKFINKLIDHLSVYMECPKDRIVWVKISEEIQKSISLAPFFFSFYHDNKLALYKTGAYRFYLRIFLGKKEFSDSIQLPLFIKKGDIYFSISDDKKEISDNASDYLDDISKHVIATISELIDRHLQFYKLPNENTQFSYIPGKSEQSFNS